MWARVGLVTCIAMAASVTGAQAAPPPFAKTTDAAKTKQADKLNTEGLVLHRAKDYANAEAKYEAALALDPGHVLARYNLACVYNLTNRTPLGIAQLAILVKVPQPCPACLAAVDGAAWDTDWESQWGELALWDTIAAERAAQPASDGPPTKLVCPAGTTQHGKWSEQKDKNEIYCALPGDIRHGPSIAQELGYSMGEGAQTDQGEYRHGKRWGMWSHTESYGESTWGAYVDDVPIGFWHASHKDKERDEAYASKGGKLTGKTRTIDNGTNDVLVEGAYAGGKKVGHWRTWYGDPHVLSEEGDYDKDKKVGAWTAYDDKGKLAVVATWDHDVPDGAFEYYRDGKLVEKTQLAKGTGAWIGYEYGELVARGHLEANVRTGVWEETGFGGWAVGPYAAGKREGAWVAYTKPDKKVKLAEGSYAKDKQTGAWVYYREDDGKVAAKGSYVGGVVEGKWLIYTAAGGDAPAQTLVAHGGKLVTVDGKPASKDDQRGWNPTGLTHLIEPMPDLPYGP